MFSLQTKYYVTTCTRVSISNGIFKNCFIIFPKLVLWFSKHVLRCLPKSSQKFCVGVNISTILMILSAIMIQQRVFSALRNKIWLQSRDQDCQNWARATNPYMWDVWKIHKVGWENLREISANLQHSNPFKLREL